MSFYESNYRDVRRACFRLLCHGVRFDVAEARRLAVELVARKDTIKDELDAGTGGYKLYAEQRHRSPAIVHLLARKRTLTDEKNAIPRSDKAARKEKLAAIKELAAQASELRASGGDVVVERGTGLSDVRIAHYLYGVLGLPAHRKRRKDTGKITLTVDDVTLKKLEMLAPQYKPLLRLILEHRKANKLLGYLDESHVDADGRLRSLYKPFGTQTGRLSSAENPLGTGTNLQNFDRSLKYLLIPDEG